MASLHRASVLSLLVACTPVEPMARRTTAPPLAPSSIAASPTATPAARPAPTAAPGEPMVVADVDAGFAFLDPDRRSKLAAALAAIDAVVDDERQKQQLPGLALGIVIDGELAYAKGFGVTDLETKAKPDADTVYRIGSISKSFTGLALLALRDEGALALEDPLVRWIPEASKLVYPSRDARPITLRQLLTHTSGLPRMGTYAAERAPSEDAMAKSLAQLPLDNTPGVLWSYSNLGFSLLSIVVARAAHAPFHEVSASSRRIDGFVGISRDVAPPIEIKKATDALAALIARWDDGAYRRLVAKAAQNRDAARAAFADLRTSHHACKVAALLHEGFDWRAELDCDRGGGLTLNIAMNKKDPSQLDRHDFRAPPGCPVR